VLYHLFDHLLGGANYAYKSVLFRSTCSLMLGFCIVWLFGPRVIRALVRRKVGDIPEFDHAPLNEMTRNKADTPTMGGVLIIAAMLACTLLLADLSNYYIRMGLFCMVWLGVLGGIDDWLKLSLHRRSGTRGGLRTYEKLLFQIALGVLLGYFIYQHGRNNYETFASVGPEQVPTYKVLTVPFYKGNLMLSVGAFMAVTVIVIAGTSNAVNLTDGLDGLAGGCVAVCSFVFMVISFLVGDADWAGYLLLPHVPFSGELAIVCGAMTGACLGFLWYNCHPAMVFMGDTGSLPLGGVIGYVAIVTRHELMLFIVGGVFVIEALSVILQVGFFKATGGRRLFRIAPIHHHYQLGGWTETQTVTRFWLLGIIFAALALATIKLR
jgi:phospho-N-acetylmuramoyl-pentapeptide-transferase